jgi:hypothetical protein
MKLTGRVSQVFYVIAVPIALARLADATYLMAPYLTSETVIVRRFRQIALWFAWC